MPIKEVINQIKRDTQIWRSEIHGIEHWRRVEQNGHLVAEANGGDKDVITYFSYLHDCQRWNEFEDPSHGPRAAAYAKRHRPMIELDDRRFKVLLRACSGHTSAAPCGRAGADPTIAACWDADRLDIDRVGISVDPHYLFSAFAKDLVAWS